MAAPQVAPPPPPGFELETAAAAPPPPPGFELEQNALPPPPAGFELESQAAPEPTAIAPASTPPGSSPLTVEAAAPAQPVLAQPPILGPLPAQRPPAVSLETAANPLPAALQPLLPRTQRPEALLATRTTRRLPDKVLADFQQGRRDLTDEEFAGVVSHLERGLFDDPKRARDTLSLSLNREGVELLDQAILVNEILQRRAAPDRMLGEGAATFSRALARGATLNAPVPQTSRPMDRKLQELARANKRANVVQDQAHPVASLGGEALGSVLPFSAGTSLLRGLRVARGAAPLAGDTAAYTRSAAEIEAAFTAPGSTMTQAQRDAALRSLDSRLATTGDIVKEGAKVGGPQSFLTRPEGSEDMTAGEEFTARALQGGIGLAAGAVLDYGSIKAGEKLLPFVNRLAEKMRDKRFERAINQEAKARGFDSSDEYLASLVDFEQTADGVVVRPKAEVVELLPGTKPRAPASGSLNQNAPALPAAPQIPPFPREAELRAQAHARKARDMGLTDEQTAAFAPAENTDPLTGFQGRRDRDATLKRAVDYAQQHDQPSHYIAMDLANLGGLNKRFGEPGADKIFRDYARIIQEELDGLPGHVNLFRHGGDEMSGVVIGADQAAIDAALERVRARALAYAEQNALTGIPHTKAGNPPGTGVHYAYAPIGKGSNVKDVSELAHGRLELKKVEAGYVNSDVSQEIRPRGPAEQTAGAGGVRPQAGGGSGGEGTGAPGAPTGADPAQAKRAQINEYERLAAETSEPGVRADLLRRADILRGELRGEPVKLTPEERKEAQRKRLAEARRVRPESDDLLTAIRKFGGIDTDIETDWAGRLSHLPRTGFGLPAIERPRAGRTLDDLAEVLHEHGYLMRRDVGELYEKLDRAAAGETLHSFKVQPDEGAAASPRPQSSDKDWIYTDADDPRALESDFVIDTDSGTVVPSRAFTPEDWARLEQEERHAEEWFRRENEEDQPGDQLRGGRADRPAQRLDDPLSGRAGDQSRAGETGDLPGLEPRNRTRQALADLERAKDAARNGQRTVDPGEGPGDLFSGRSRQTDIDDFKIEETNVPTGRAGEAVDAGRGDDAVQLELYFDAADAPQARRDALQTLNRRVKHVATGSFPTGLKQVKTPADVAHVVAPLRKEAQESLLTVVTDQDGKVLRISRLFKGGTASTDVHPSLVAGAAASTPGGRNVWFVHNHPGGSTGQSKADMVMTTRVHELMKGSGVEPRGMIVVGPGDKFTHYLPQNYLGRHLPDPEDPDFRLDSEATGVKPEKVPAHARRDSVPVTERKLVGITPEGPSISAASAARHLDAIAGKTEGILLLDNQNRAVGFLPMTREEMASLRRGVDGPAHRLFAAIDETNANTLIARIHGDDGEVMRAAGNLSGFAHLNQVRFLDLINKEGKSFAQSGQLPSQSTFYANPFLLAAGDVARDIGLHPGRALGSGFAGGVVGATNSDAEVGTAKWWLDVAAGAGGGVLVGQLLRKTNLLGKGSIVDNGRAWLGEWIDNLPLIGRGPGELQELKRKQRLMRQFIDRQTEATGRELLKNFSPAERAMMSDLIETRGIVKDFNLIHRQAQVLDDYLVHVGSRMKELGMLSEELELGGYLHRYYAKHLGLDKGFRQAKGQSLAGSYSIARGTDDTFRREFFSPGASKVLDEFDAVRAQMDKLEKERVKWQRKATKAAREGDLHEETITEALQKIDDRLDDLKAELRAIKKKELREFTGLQNGKLRSFLFAADEVPRVDTGAKPVLAQTHKPGPGLDTRAMPVAPGVSELTPTGRAWFLRGTKDKEALLHRDWTKAERQSWGEIDDAGYRYVRGMAEASHDLSLATLFKTVADNSEWVSDAPRAIDGKEWVRVPTSRVHKNSPLEKYGALAGKYVRPDVWNGIRNYGRAPFAAGRIGDLYRAGLMKWKLYKTVYNPVTHFNNTYSNMEMLHLAGYGQRDLAKGVSHIAQGEGSKLWREARDAGLFGQDWASSLLQKGEGGGTRALEELAEQLRTQPEIPDAALATSVMMDIKKWWIDSANAVKGAGSTWRSGVELAKAMGQPALAGARFTLRPVKAAARSMQRLYQWEDNIFKMAVYQAERAKGRTPDQAVRAALDSFFDYQDVPEAIKWVRDFPVGSPFVTYTYKAIPAVARNIVQNPERYLALLAGYEAWNYAVMAEQGMSPGEYWQIESAEDEASAPWEQGRSLWGARNMVHLPSPEGYRLAMGRAHAVGNPFMTEAGGREKLPAVPGLASFWGSSFFGSNPLHALLDVAVNEDWRGKEIYKPGAPDAEKAKAAAAYLYQAWSPSNMLTPGGYHQAKVLEGLANDARKEPEGVAAPIVAAANGAAEALGFGQFTGLDRTDNEIQSRDALLASFGIKLRPIQFDMGQEIETARIMREIEKKNTWFNNLMGKAAENRLTDAQVKQAEEQLDAELAELYEKLDKRDAVEKTLRDADRWK